MQDRSWISDFLRRWSRKGYPLSEDDGFYAALRSLQAESLKVPPAIIDRTEPVSETDALLLDLLRAWNIYVDGHTVPARQKVAAIGRQLRGRPEVWIFVGLIALASGNRGQAWQALSRAQRLDNRNEPLRILLGRFGERRAPVLPFLDRGNPLNVALGKVRARVFS
ncbi:MAG: hypothetical protein D6761_12355 [Candidatus Dadabacteria bacterium]|nr:MAG: hypothetical protein D6761_12355 [Candidatus Dadabacteria bacterium]